MSRQFVQQYYLNRVITEWEVPITVLIQMKKHLVSSLLLKKTKISKLQTPEIPKYNQSLFILQDSYKKTSLLNNSLHVNPSNGTYHIRPTTFMTSSNWMILSFQAMFTKQAKLI